MTRRLVSLAALCLILVIAGSAEARNRTPGAGRGPAVKVLECRTGDTSGSRSASFLGRMRSQAGTDRMAMRFTLMEQFGDEKLHAVDFPELRAWRFSKPGIKDFRFKQTVTALEAGGDYRMRVEFRWLDAAGNLQHKTQRLSPTCRQAGDLANLRAGAPTASAGPEGTGIYQVPVMNDGKVAAADVGVELYVDGAATNVGHIDSVAPGETREVRFTGPTCKRNLRVVVDPGDTVKERLESDNVTILACPPVKP